MPRRPASTVMTLRVPREVEKRIEHVARRQRRTKSAVVREVIEGAFAGVEAGSAPAAEARRQSLLVSGRASEKEALRFVRDAADARGWK